MEKTDVVEEQFKKRMKIICFMPAILFLLTTIYSAGLLLPLTQGHPLPDRAVGIISNHYTTLFIFLAAFSIVSAAVLIYCIVHLVRIKTLNTPQKMKWMLLLLATPVSFILFRISR
jgi:hypothetical protein